MQFGSGALTRHTETCSQSWTMERVTTTIWRDKQTLGDQFCDAPQAPQHKRQHIQPLFALARFLHSQN